MKALVATACAAVIAATSYFFMQEYRTSVATAEAEAIERDKRVCELLDRTTKTPAQAVAYTKMCGF